MTEAASRMMPGHLIRRLHQRSTQVFATAMAEAGEDLTPVQFAIIDHLAHRSGLDQATLARSIGKDRATVGSVAERLERKGLIARTANEADKRAILLDLTPRGAELHRRIAPRVARVQTEILPGLTDEQRATFIALAAHALSAAED